MRRFLTILSFILLTATASFSQSGRVSSGGDPADRIVRLYPNPASTYITFDLQNTTLKGLSLKIFNGVLGKKMFDANNISNKTTITLNDYTRGIYIYQLVDASGKIIESGKFQVSH
ncbi:MAG: T9SS type A sorting domain-containing protein [Chitinophagaceae bacterium]|nr:T9SS type A sorting domain-containing protein [Chitinophagaceae bacterium]MBK8952387.1 T9SS type A sorting domain-containing protein [Chitinophagaceae bacterium]